MSERLAWTGLVLASGRSRRFGGLDKARLPLGGRTLLQRALDALMPVTATCLVVGPRARREAPWVADGEPDGGPVAGLRAGLASTATTHALVVACDLPFLTSSFLAAVQHVGATADVAVIDGPGSHMPLCLSVRRACLEAIDAYWSRGGRRMAELARQLPHVVVPDALRRQHDPAGRLLLNVNDPLTYARALAEAQHDCGASYFTDLDESKHTP